MVESSHRRKVSQRRAYKKWYRKSANRAAKVKEARLRVSVIRQRNIAKLREIKGARGCSRCPEKDPICLDFHHRDPSQKKFAISRQKILKLINPWPLLFEEMEKCDILCANCHRKHTLT